MGVHVPNLAANVNPNTGRVFGDHGTANDAIEFILEVQQAPGEETEFLRAWRDGSAWEEWPEFYDWLAKERR